MSTSPSSVPRIPITNVYAANINWWLSASHLNAAGTSNRTVELVLYYEDGTSTVHYMVGYSYNAEWFEIVFSVGVLNKKVVKAEVRGKWGATRKVMLDWQGNTDNPVFDVGDSPSFKVRFNTTYQLG